jgi:dolichyl-phosphate beta-glucosyltransferase
MGAFLDLASRGAEVIFVDDGSTDRTLDFLQANIAESSGVRVEQLETNRGKGAAVRRGVHVASQDYVVFMDADLATDLSELGATLQLLDTYDVVIGSRSAEPGRFGDASIHRQLMGRCFNAFVRRVTGLPFRDTQCGFKAFRSEYAKIAFSLSELDGFAFDVEILMRVRNLGGSIIEIPVNWQEVKGSHVKPASDSISMARDVLRARRLTDKSGQLVHIQVHADAPESVGDSVGEELGAPLFVSRAGVQHYVCSGLSPKVASFEVSGWLTATTSATNTKTPGCGQMMADE